MKAGSGRLGVGSRMSLAIAVLGLAASLAGVLFPAPIQAKYVASGVVGNVYVTGCPGADAYDDPRDCSQPYQAKIRVLTARDRDFVKSFRTRSDGSFKVHLRPGRYILDPRPSSKPYPRPVKRYRVTVEKDRFTYVRIDYDGGSR
jgi:hypothetical protein